MQLPRGMVKKTYRLKKGNSRGACLKEHEKEALREHK